MKHIQFKIKVQRDQIPHFYIVFSPAQLFFLTLSHDDYQYVG